MINIPDSSASDNLGMTNLIPRQNEENQCFANLTPLIPFVYVLPRSKDKIKDADNKPLAWPIQNVLPDFFAYGPNHQPWRQLEGRFYVDIANNIGGVWKAERKITVVCAGIDGTPVPNTPVSLRRSADSSQLLKFVALDGSETDELQENQAPQTDQNGMAEIKIRHPACTVPPNQRRVQIEATIAGDSAWVGLMLTRNDAVTDLENIARKSETCADGIWVYQPDPNDRSPASDDPINQKGITKLQETLNEVVSRHKGIASFNFIDLDGIYSDKTRDAIASYRNQFTDVKKGSKYPYDLSGINLSPNLREYLKSEYNFVPDEDDHLGWVVDRQLLIGDKYDPTPANIDGLLELKEAVVDQLKNEMVRIADLYVTESTFWLHRKTHKPYKAGTALVCRVKQTSVVRVEAKNNAAHLQNNGSDVQVQKGELYPSPDGNASWIQITHSAGAGWIPASVCAPRGSKLRFTDDQANTENAGTCGSNGVAYSWRCKLMPDEFARDLANNTLALPTEPSDATDMKRRIANWDEYEDKSKPGRTEDDDNDAAADMTKFTGCDCSGFIQNCITHANLTDGTRAVPDAVLQILKYAAKSRWPGPGDNACISASHFPDKGRLLDPYPSGNDDKTHFMRKGDLISTTGHIVFVAEDRPAITGPDHQTFLVYNEYGMFTYHDVTGQVITPTDQFVRKAQRMPFHWWGVSLTKGSVKIGKPYIWG